MVEIKLTYEGDLHCSATHLPSGNTLVTDAPLDNNGRGQAFSPTDLVATALGSCMATVIGIVARRKELPVEGMTVNVRKIHVGRPAATDSSAGARSPDPAARHPSGPQAVWKAPRTAARCITASTRTSRW